MWFKLNTTFTTSLGKLSELTNSWPITRYLTNFTTASNVLNVEKNGAYEAVFTIGANCTVDATPTVTMSGIAVSASQAVWNASAGTLTVKISSVTGPVVITASATKNSSSGGDSGETPVNPPSGGMDADATAFITAASITDTAMQTKLDTLVKSLKSNNLWNKIDALYPCVGSTFEQMSYNLKNPTTFKMRSNSGVAPEVDSTGIKPTQLVVCDNYTTAPGQDFHTLAWDKNGYTVKEGLRLALCGVCSGEGLGDGGLQVQFYDNGTEGQAQIRTHGKNGRWNKKPCDVNPTGLVISSLTSGIIHNGVDLGAVMEGTPNFTKIDVLMTINGMTGEKPYLGYRGLVGFGKGLTIAEMQTYSRILNEFKNIY